MIKFMLAHKRVKIAIIRFYQKS